MESDGFNLFTILEIGKHSAYSQLEKFVRIMLFNILKSHLFVKPPSHTHTHTQCMYVFCCERKGVEGVDETNKSHLLIVAQGAVNCSRYGNKS